MFGSCVHQSFECHCCIVVERTDTHVRFIQNTDGLIELYQMRCRDFDREFVNELHDYPVARAAKLLLNGPTPITTRAEILLRRLMEPTMAATKSTKKTSSKKPAPKAAAKDAPKKETAKKEEPGALVGKTVNPGKTSAKEAAAPAKKTPAPGAEKSGTRGRRGIFSDQDATVTLVKTVKEDSELKKRARMIAGFVEDAGKKITVKSLLGKIQKELDKLGQRDPAEAILQVHGKALLDGGFIKVG